MNLLYICDEYPPGPNGGMGSMVQVLAREMARQGHHVFVAGLYTYRYGGRDYEEDQGVKVWRMRYGLNLPDTANGFWYKLQRKLPRPIRSRLNGRKAFDRFIHFIQALVSSEQIDVIEVPDWNTFAYDIGFRVQWPAFPVPLIVKSHGSHTYFSQELHQVPIREWAETDRLLYQRADALSAVSHYTAGKNKVLFDTEKPITVLHNSIRVLPELPFDKRAEQQVVFSGTLTYKKGIFSLMKAWNIVAGQFPAATLSVYGKGDIKPLQALLEPDYLPSVQFMGHQPRELLFGALGTATLAVFPSYSETFGLAPVEAMSLGCPVIFTRYSCGPEIVHDEQTGLLADPDQPEDIAAAICRLLQDKALRRKLSKAGREDVLQRFDVQQSAVVHREYYDQVIAAFKHDRNG